jgi:tetratricopeptide (TPR) repeat protein
MLLRVGEFDGATTELKTALRLDPRSLGGHEGLGLIYLQQGKLDDGAEEFRRTLAIKPGYPVAEKDLARTLARQHQWAEAVRLLRQILVVNPNSIEESSSLATALANLGDKAGAAAQFARARQLSNQELLLLRAQGDRNWGVSLRKEGRLQDAAAAFRRAIQDDASYGEAHDDLGEVLWMQNDLSGALSEFEIAVRCNPGSGLARNNLGSALLYYQHDIDRAIEELRSALTSRPGFALAHLNLGKALAAKQDFAAAEMELRSAIAITPDFAAAHLNLGLVIAARKGSLSTEAQVEMEKGLRLDPRLREMIPQQYLLYVR